MMASTIRVSAAAAFLMIAVATRVAAQGECGTCQDTYQGGFEHQFASVGAFFRCAPNNCHYFSPSPGICSEYHYICNVGRAKPGVDDAQILRSVAEAVTRVDISQLHALVTASPALLRYGDGGRVIEHLGCDGRVVGVLTIASQLVIDARRPSTRWSMYGLPMATIASHRRP